MADFPLMQPDDNRLEGINVKAIADDACQAAFALIATRLEQATGHLVTGDMSPHETFFLDEAFQAFVRAMAVNIDSSRPATPKTLMVATFDVTDLPNKEWNALEMEVAVQAEASDFVGEDEHGWQGHRGVPMPKIDVITNKREES